jgi:hypothetical protein
MKSHYLLFAGVVSWMAQYITQSFYPFGVLAVPCIFSFIVIVGLQETVMLRKFLRFTSVLGGLMNFSCVVANGGKMPVFPYYAYVTADVDYMHSVIGASTHLYYFCDIIPAKIAILSFGDVLLFSSLILIGFIPKGTK